MVSLAKKGVTDSLLTVLFYFRNSRICGHSWILCLMVVGLREGQGRLRKEKRLGWLLPWSTSHSRENLRSSDKEGNLRKGLVPQRVLACCFSGLVYWKHVYIMYCLMSLSPTIWVAPIALHYLVDGALESSAVSV